MNEKTQMIDSVEYEVIDFRQAETLGEIPIEYENDEEITKPDSATQVKLFVGVAETDVVVSSLNKTSGKVSGELAIEKQNVLFVADAIEKLLSAEKPWDEPIEKKSGKDDLLIFYSSSWAHNLPAPLERVVVRNRRRYVIDGLRAHLLGLEMPPGAARKFIAEIRKLFL
jgi:hypothetical protein